MELKCSGEKDISSIHLQIYKMLPHFLFLIYFNKETWQRKSLKW
mgnify:FL=1